MQRKEQLRKLSRVPTHFRHYPGSVALLRNKFVAAALEWKGTPYNSQGAVKGVGASCVGFLIGLAREFNYAGANETRWQYYTQNPRAPEIMRILKEHLIKVPRAQALPGDVLLIRCIQQPQHLALLIYDAYIIHASEQYGGVTVHRIDSWWSDRIIGVFQFPEFLRG